jgi:hypothetical protein
MEHNMKPTPMQKYALRLLLAANRIEVPNDAVWQRLKSESAASTLSRFGGVYRAIKETELPRKPVASRLETDAATPVPAQYRELNNQPSNKEQSCPNVRTF